MEDRELALQILENKKAEEQKRKELLEAYATLAFTPSGARVMAHLEAQLREVSYATGRDAMEVAFREGQRAVVLAILDNVAAGQRLIEQGDLNRSDLQTIAEQGDIFDA